MVKAFYMSAFLHQVFKTKMKIKVQLNYTMLAMEGLIMNTGALIRCVNVDYKMCFTSCMSHMNVPTKL